MARIGILGASGYTGVELLRLLAGHPDFEVAYATADSHAGTRAADLYPSLAAAYPDLTFEAIDPARVDGLDLVFLALPHGTSMGLMADLRKRAGKIVDLAADFRLRDPGLYPTWYGEEHTAPELLAEFASASPSCSATTCRAPTWWPRPAVMPRPRPCALAPLVRAGLVEASGVVVDAASGVSGAGRALKHTTHFGTVNEDFTAYGLLTHRHTPEIEQATGRTGAVHTPSRSHDTGDPRHLLRPTHRPTSTGALLEALRHAYQGEPFVVVGDDPPSTKSTLGSNSAHLTARYDDRTGWVVVLGALDNLVKGASGQALQCANLALGLPETTGLPVVGMYP